VKLVVVTASTDFTRAKKCVDSWGNGVETIVVMNGPKAKLAPTAQLGQFTILSRQDYLGTVPAFKAGVDYALAHTDADVIACLHDDLQILDAGWVEKVCRRFEQQPAVGLLGFGGAIGLGDVDIYQKPYQPMQLARVGFRSNLVDAEVHGGRSLLAERIACLDGFSQVGRRAFWNGYGTDNLGRPRPWSVLEGLGITHHMYDGALGLLAARYGWEVWYEPIRCRHFGGQTAVGDAGYQSWAAGKVAGGDHGFWEQAHKATYEAFRDQLPLRV
jgi:hypothetical protein